MSICGTTCGRVVYLDAQIIAGAALWYSSAPDQTKASVTKAPSGQFTPPERETRSQMS